MGLVWIGYGFHPYARSGQFTVGLSQSRFEARPTTCRDPPMKILRGNLFHAGPLVTRIYIQEKTHAPTACPDRPAVRRGL